MKFLKYLVIFLVVCSASFFAVGIFNPTVSYESTVLVNKPIRHSFNTYSNPFYLDKWLPGFKSVRPISGLPFRVGSINELVFVENGEDIIMTQEVTGFEVNRLFSFKLSNEVLVTHVEITFEEADGKSRITSVSEIRGNNLIFRSLFPFMKAEFKERDQKAYDNLKDLIEGSSKQGNLLIDLFMKMG